MPLNAADGSSPAHDLEHALHPWVAFGVLPAFAFANAGLSLTDIGLSDLLHPIQLGIGLGLFIGKQLGVIASIWIATRVGLATLPEGTDWRHIYGVALLTGTGFTMSLFMGTLAFPAEAYDADVRIAVLSASVASAICGYLVLRRASSRRSPIIATRSVLDPTLRARHAGPFDFQRYQGDMFARWKRSIALPVTRSTASASAGVMPLGSPLCSTSPRHA
jgi:hypothetical protein